MTRPSLRLAPVLESLEVRQVLSSVAGPSADKQYALELINLVRTDPAKAGQVLTADISPSVQDTLSHFGLTVSGLQSELDSAKAQPPLAYSDALDSSAQQQSQYEADTGVQGHTGAGGTDLSTRTANAGYTNMTSVGENTYAYADSVDEAMQSFLFDWGVSDHGHYANLLQPGTSAADSYKDVGIGLVSTGANGVGPMVVTQDFGSQSGEGPQILGVVYNDPNHTGLYAPGEGLGGVAIDAQNLATGQDYPISTWASGGYQVPVAPNAYYKVTATQNGQEIGEKQIYVGDENEKVDFTPSNAPAQEATPAPTHPAEQVVASTPPATPSNDQAIPDNLASTPAAPPTPPAPPAPAPAVPSTPPATVTTPPAQAPTHAATGALASWSRWTAASV